MTPEQFAYWLQGFVELNGGKQPSPEQWESVVAHLKTVFNKVTPPILNFPPGVRAPEFRDQLDRAWPSKLPQITC